MPVTTRSRSQRQDMAQANKTGETTQTSQGFFREHSSPKLGRRALRNRGQSQDLKPEEGLKVSRDEPPGDDEPDWRASTELDGTEQDDDSSDTDPSYVESRHRNRKPARLLKGNRSDFHKGRLGKSEPQTDTKRKDSETMTPGKESRVARHSDTAEKYPGSKSVGLFVYVFFALVSAGFCLYVYGSIYAGKLPPEFQQDMQTLKGSFPAQEEQFWDIVEATVEDHLSQGSDPLAPIVLMFGSRPDAARSNKCLANKLGLVLSTTLATERSGVIPIDGKAFANRDAHSAKEEIDRILKAGFEGGQKVAVIFNLDALPPCSVLLFHSYCENEDARYKDVALIFTVTLDEDQPGSQENHRSKPMNLKGREGYLISEHLLKAWVDKCDQLPREKVEAMLSRVANNVGIFHHEEKVPCF